ncbi:MAG: S9 family peptidase, partial [Woeseia sp.]|nr:S9 family peptidase [Woeseia sp.]
MNCPTKTFATVGIVLACLFFTNILAQEGARRPFQPEDIHRLNSVGDIATSPDGEWLVYSVGTTNVDKDSSGSDLFMVSWDGSERIQLTHTEDSGEGNPRFSPDGRYIAFVAARSDGNSEDPEDSKGKSQVWLLNRSGGEAERLTAMPGGVSSFEW